MDFYQSISVGVLASLLGSFGHWEYQVIFYLRVVSRACTTNVQTAEILIGPAVISRGGPWGVCNSAFPQFFCPVSANPQTEIGYFRYSLGL